jgi:hypothetical protein
VARTMKRLNQELSPLRDENTRDVGYVRSMWEQYNKQENFDQATKEKHIKLQEHNVHAYLKQMESGADHPDTKTLTALAEGLIKKDDEKVKAYYIK